MKNTAMGRQIVKETKRCLIEEHINDEDTEQSERG